MKIALLSFEYPAETGFGGIGTYTWYQARALVKLGHQVHVLAGAREATPLREEAHDGVRVFRFWSDGPAMNAFNVLGDRFKLWWTRQRLQNAWSMYHGISALHREHRYDVLEMPECGAEGALITRRLDVPTVVRLHSPSRLIMPFYDVLGTDTMLCSTIEQRALRRATALTGCSRFVADEVHHKMGVDKRITVVTNGLDVDLFDRAADPIDVYAKYGLPQRDLMIVFTGRMEPRKGIHLCTDIVRSILKRFDVSFVFAGSDLFGHVARTMLPALNSEQLKGSVHWLGPLSQPEIRQLSGAADIFFLPSLWENCPYSCLEAMTASRAIVAADQGGMPELIRHGVNGLLAKSGDAQAFADCLEQLIGDAALRHRLGCAARQTIDREHRDTHVAAAAVRVYQEAVSARS